MKIHSVGKAIGKYTLSFISDRNLYNSLEDSLALSVISLSGIYPTDILTMRKDFISPLFIINTKKMNICQ